tara:strand:- start:40590 stop:40805 length:216 start_codon:yes stop_codon:yes gene_type:complete
MAKVNIKQSESFERALKRFKRKVEDDGIVKNYREIKYYSTKGEKKREAKKAAVRRHKKQLRKSPLFKTKKY